MKVDGSQNAFSYGTNAKVKCVQVLSSQCTKASMHIEIVLTINSQDIHSDFHTTVYRLATLPLKQTYANAAICLHVNLVSTKSCINILDQKDFYYGVMGLKARGYRNEVEGNHKFRAILVSNHMLRFNKLETVRCYTHPEHTLP